MRAIFIALFAAVCAPAGYGVTTVTYPIGASAFWPGTINWVPISTYDGVDSSLDATVDFVGDASNPALFYAKTTDYVFFRMRVASPTYTAVTRDSYLLLIDIPSYGVTGIDYAFAWDAKSAIVADHGLEMCLAGTNGPTWGASQLKDNDATPASKTTKDINGAGRTTDGYVRTTDSQSTTHFGNTTLVDLAVRWDFLSDPAKGATNLTNAQNWLVTAATISNATDHNAFNSDVIGAATLTESIANGWATIPEPSSALIGLLLGAGWLCRRQRGT
jgi:hypothetical protein